MWMLLFWLSCMHTWSLWLHDNYFTQPCLIYAKMHMCNPNKQWSLVPVPHETVAPRLEKPRLRIDETCSVGNSLI